MSPHWMTLALLCGQLGSDPDSAPKPPPAPQVERPAAPRPPHVIVSEAAKWNRREKEAKEFEDRKEAIEGLVKLYAELRESMRQGNAALLVKEEYRLRQKLVNVVKDLNRKVIKAEEQAKRQTARLLRNPAKYSESSLEEPTLQGGGTIGAANNLIQIIVTTIDPDGWQVNGGTHVIEYWANGMALVVAAPIDVHEAIGGSLAGMRGASR